MYNIVKGANIDAPQNHIRDKNNDHAGRVGILRSSLTDEAVRILRVRIFTVYS